MNRTLDQLTIVHNHGEHVLENVELVPTGDSDCVTAKGTIVKGHSTSRLGMHSKTHHEVPGTEKEIYIWNRRISQMPDGTHRVDITVCG